MDLESTIYDISNKLERWQHYLKRLELPKKPSIICLCGSTRFAQVFNEVAIAKTLAGYIVLRPEVVTYDGDTDPQFDQPEVKEALDELHKRKIDLADSVFVIDVDGYIGPSTRSEIEYAEGLGIPVEYYSEVI